MKLTVSDGDRVVCVEDKATAYDPATLNDWANQAAALLRHEDFAPRGDVFTTTETRQQWDHDIREPIGFAR